MALAPLCRCAMASPGIRPMDHDPRAHLRRPYRTLELACSAALLIGCLAVGSSESANGLESTDLAPPVIQEDADDHWIAFGSSDEAGLNNSVDALIAFRGDLIAGGIFSTSGAQRLAKVARWDGSAWHSLRDGVDNFDCPGLECVAFVTALATDEVSLYVGGWFPSVDRGRPARNVARWDGEMWYPLGLGVDGIVRALTLYNGDLVAGGDFTEAGGLPANRVARWDGTQWHPLGEGLDGTVSWLTVFQGEVIASGVFHYSGDVPVHYIGRWDGDSWSSLGGGFTQSGTGGFAIFQEKLVTRGSFVSATAQQTSGPVIWDGSEWRPLGPANTLLGRFVVYNERLIAGGNLPQLNHVVEWTGTEWKSLGSGVGGRFELPYALAVRGASLFVGGDFTTAGGKVSHRLAQWNDIITALTVEELSVSVGFDGVHLGWRLGDPGTVFGVRVQRAEVSDGPFQPRSNLLSSARDMTFVDCEILAGATYWYRLILFGTDGSESATGAIRVHMPEAQLGTILFPSRRSRDERSTEVRYSLGHSENVLLQLYDVRGRLLQTLDRGVKGAGEYIYLWDGTREGGPLAARGVYFVSLTADGATRSRKFVHMGH